MDTVDGSNTDDLWTPYKELVSIIENNLGRADNGPYTAFESALRRHKQTFLSLMKNSPKNAASREEIRRGVTEGVNLPSTGRTILSRELVDEAIIISDMYDVNEYAALELLHTAQRHSPRHPGLPRGLVAVLLYYDGRRAIVQALKELVMARRGVSWCVDASPEVISHVTSYVESLLSSGLLGHVMDALDTLELAGEVALLQSNRALGGPRHNAQVVATLEDIRHLLSGIIFAASAQRGLTKDTLVRLLTQLCRDANPAGGGAAGALDDVALALHMALLYAIDLSVIHRRDDGEELARTLPLITEPDLLPALLIHLAPPPEGSTSVAGARALAQLALGLALAALRRAPGLVGAIGDALEQDEVLVEAAVDGNVFEYIHEVLLSNERVHKEEYYMRRLHTLITDFVVLMHSKLMDLRLKADEAARATQLYAAEGLSETAPAPRGHFHALLHCVERLYEVDAWALRGDYWAAADYQHSHSYRSGGRSVSLFKFVRLAGELVAPPLLAPYLRALGSLAVAPHTHALLARRDAPAAHAVSAAAVSWDHLFGALARYYCNLRQDPTPLVDHHSSSLGGSAVTGAAGTARGRRMVRPDEVEALIAALRLVRAVARVDAHACAAISEHPQWDAINCMFGLIGCHIPLRLKAELALALAALGSTAGTAPRVWAALEAAQLIRTVPTTSTYAVGVGVEAELEEVEARDEEYPLTRAMLTLLTSLCTAAPAPRALGAGPRAPGLAPYAAYAVRTVALTAPHRGYRDVGEKWQVLSLSLRLFTTWLMPYVPTAADYPRSAAEASAPPGWMLALQLHTQTPLLGLVLSLMEECVAALAGWGAVAGKNHLEDCALSCLQLIDKALQIERQFITEFTPVCNILITGLSKLLLGTNLGAGKSEPVLNIARMVTFGSQLPRHALLAVSVLTQLAALPGAHQHVLYVLTADEATRVEIRHGFVECLEAEDLSDSDSEAAPSVTRQTQESIVRLMQRTVSLPAPSLAHYLLGFRLTGDISRTAFCEPGVNGFPRTCLHSVLDILDDSIAGSKLMGHRWPIRLLEQAYCLLYTVCARPQTSAPVLRYLRSRDAFLVRHVRATPAPENASASWLCARAWLLRASACELGASAAAKQDSALGLLVRALTDAPHDRRVGRDTTTSDSAAGSSWCGLRRLLDGLATTSAAPPEPRWEFFHAPQLRTALESCEQTAVGNGGVGGGGKRINVTRLHALLARELGALQATAPQRGLVAREIEKVLEYATQINKQRNLASSIILYYDSWRQIAEILFCVASQDILPLDTKQSLLLNVLQDILNKISPADVLPQLGNLASGTILLLLVNLRHCYVTERRRSDLKLSDFEISFFGPSNNLMQTNSLSLKFILQKILNWILVSGVSTQKMRINLYSALLNYMHIVNLKTGYEDLVSCDDTLNVTYVSRLDSSKTRLGKEESSLRSMVIEVIAGFGDSLCNVVCADCVGAGHEVCRMVALSCLDTLLEIHPHTDWLNILTNKGYLRNLIDSLLQDDAGLIQVLEPSPPSLKALYVYESKLTLLSKMASSRVGAETVLAQGALSCLANMRVFDYHPDIQSGYPGPDDLDTDFIPPVSERYRSIFAPALSLCDALLTTLGSENHSCLLHVTHWLLSHADAVETVLRAANPKSPTGLLQELEGISSVISRATSPEVFSYVERDISLQDSGVTLYRIQSLMLALFPRFNSMLKDINMGATRPSQFLSINSRTSADKGYVGEDNLDDTPDRAVLCLKIICNLLTYVRNVTQGAEQRVLFKPVLTGSSGQWNETGDRAPHLGVLVQQLEYTVKHCQAEKNALEILNSHLRRVPDMTIAELQELIPSAERDGRARALQRVARRLAAKRREVALAAYAIESCLHLLWAHLDYYMRRAVPTELGIMGGELALNTSLSPAEAVYKSYSSELSELKQGLVSVFNDTFTKDLLDTSADQGSSQRGLIDILLRDIKCLVQFVPVK